MTTPERSRLMSRIRGKNTGPELSVRRLAHSWGFRFRLHRRELPGYPDLVFPRLRAVLPKTRAEWCRAKLLANVERDARNLQELQSLGWDVLGLWECEIRSHRFMPKLPSFLGAPLPVPELVLNPSGQERPSLAER
jgi:DNA mismatch endonuclease (patch repair protein)